MLALPKKLVCHQNQTEKGPFNGLFFITRIVMIIVYSKKIAIRIKTTAVATIEIFEKVITFVDFKMLTGSLSNFSIMSSPNSYFLFMTEFDVQFKIMKRDMNLN